MGQKPQTPRLRDPFGYMRNLTQTHEALVQSAMEKGLNSKARLNLGTKMPQCQISEQEGTMEVISFPHHVTDGEPES